MSVHGTGAADVAATVGNGSAGRQLLAAEAAARTPTSRLLHRVDALSTSAGAAGVSAAVSMVFLLGAVVAGETDPLLTIFEALAAAITLVMVFTLQHTQARQVAALQRKLDEILRVLPGTDPTVMHLESAPEEQLEAVGDAHSGLRGDALTHADSVRVGPRDVPARVGR